MKMANTRMDMEKKVRRPHHSVRMTIAMTGVETAGAEETVAGEVTVAEVVVTVAEAVATAAVEETEVLADKQIKKGFPIYREAFFYW